MWFVNAGARVQAVGGTQIVTADAVTFRTPDLARFPNLTLGGGAAPKLIVGAGTPQGVVAAVVGSVFLNRTGAAGTTFYVKESGTGTTGWVGK